MISRRRLRVGPSLALWAGGGVAVAAAGTLLAVAVGLAVTGRLDSAARAALLGGTVAAVLAALGAALAGHRLGTAVRALRREALRRLQDPAAPSRPSTAPPAALRASVELLELARTLDALHVRVRMADEIAQRHRRTARTASAGMFELLSGLVAAEEDARGQLAADLHDTAAQTLMLARSQLATGASGPVADLVAEAEEQVRAVMARTRPPELRDGDLAQAVAGLRDDLRARYALEVRFSWPAKPHPLPLVTAVTVYRFFQEALLNVVKHADVDVADARLDLDEGEVVATVSDEGPGFDPGQVRPDRGRHVGLGLLRERARLAGGSLEVVSAPGRATTVTLRLPGTAGAARHLGRSA